MSQDGCIAPLMIGCSSLYHSLLARDQSLQDQKILFSSEISQHPQVSEWIATILRLLWFSAVELVGRHRVKHKTNRFKDFRRKPWVLLSFVVFTALLSTWFTMNGFLLRANIFCYGLFIDITPYSDSDERFSQTKHIWVISSFFLATEQIALHGLELCITHSMDCWSRVQQSCVNLCTLRE